MLRELYTECYKHPGYGMGEWRRVQTEKWVERNLPSPGRWLDVGCGRGEMLMYADSHGHEVRGCEIVPDLCEAPAIDLIKTAASLPYDDEAFDTVSCFDVLEHVLPEETEQVLAEIFRVAKKAVFFGIAFYPCKMYGHDLHINLRSPEEWESLIRIHQGWDWHERQIDRDWLLVTLKRTRDVMV